MKECKNPDEILESIADELTQLPGGKFLKVIGFLKLCAKKSKDLRAKLGAAEKGLKILDQMVTAYQKELRERDSTINSLRTKLEAVTKERDEKEKP